MFGGWTAKNLYFTLNLEIVVQNISNGFEFLIIYYRMHT